jgi:hypothetical protein
MNHKCPACNYEYRFEGLKLVSGEEGIYFYEIESEHGKWEVETSSIKQETFYSKMYVCPKCGCVFVNLP